MVVKRRKTVASIAALTVLAAGAAMAAELIKVDGDYTKGDKYTGPPLKWKDPNPGVEWTADDSGDANDADHADDADEAGEGTYADEGGVTPTADHADTSDTADTATNGDTTTHADTADHADYADYAEDVAECAGGPFMGGSCGDLRYDGNLGLNVDPQHALDVAGTASLRTLGVTATGAVKVGGGALPDASLTVHGRIRADAFEVERTAVVNPANCRASGLFGFTNDSFRLDQGWLSAPGAFPTRANYDWTHCDVDLPPGARITDWECRTTGSARVSWEYRQWDEYGHNDIVLPHVVDTEEVHYVTVREINEVDSAFGGCSVTYRMSLDLTN